jgi:hypothetical protein
VKRATHKLKSFGTSRIIAPDSRGEWVEHTSKDDIKAGCQWEDSRRFSQTGDTPFMQSPLLEDFGYLAQGPASRLVLNGSYVPPSGTDVYARKLFRQLAMSPSVSSAPPMSVVMSTSDPMLASFDATMANIPYATGYSPLRWQSGTDVMIPNKSVASLRVDKLRTILLLDPEFNQNNKLAGSIPHVARREVCPDACRTIRQSQEASGR